jgi:hypothetical protein
MGAIRLVAGGIPSSLLRWESRLPPINLDPLFVLFTFCTTSRASLVFKRLIHQDRQFGAPIAALMTSLLRKT